MTKQTRSTLVVHGRHAMREAHLAAARAGRHGLQVMSFEQLAVQLAGGFIQHIDEESLRAAIQAALPVTAMGELESIKDLPGMIDAAADTLHTGTGPPQPIATGHGLVVSKPTPLRSSACSRGFSKLGIS